MRSVPAFLFTLRVARCRTSCVAGVCGFGVKQVHVSPVHPSYLVLRACTARSRGLRRDCGAYDAIEISFTKLSYLYRLSGTVLRVPESVHSFLS